MIFRKMEVNWFAKFCLLVGGGFHNNPLDEMQIHIGKDSLTTSRLIKCWPNIVFHKVKQIVTPFNDPTFKCWRREWREFSLILKNKTCFYPNLDTNKMLGSLVTVKLEMILTSVVKFKFDDELLMMIFTPYKSIILFSVYILFLYILRSFNVLQRYI